MRVVDCIFADGESPLKESLQGMCYIENLVMKNCKTINTNLAFKYSTVDVDIVGGIDSVKNPISGIIRADHISELIMEDDKADTAKTQMICKQSHTQPICQCVCLGQGAGAYV